MNLKPIRLKIFILIASGISFSVSTHAETRPSLAGLQSQINSLQAQITQADDACSCWTPQELSDLLTKVDWFPYQPGPGGSGIEKTITPPFTCTKGYDSRPVDGNDLSRALSANITYPGIKYSDNQGQHIVKPGVSVGVYSDEGGYSECTKTVNGINYVNGIKIIPGAEPPTPHGILDQTEIQQCYAQIMAVGKTLPDCDFQPITIP